MKLVITPPVDPNRVRAFEENLHQIQDLRLLLVGGSVTESAQIIVSTKEPKSLIKALSEMPLVKEAAGEGNEIRVTLEPEAKD